MNSFQTEYRVSYSDTDLCTIRTIEIFQKFNLRANILINKFDLNSFMSIEIEKWCRKNNLNIAG
jgi:MinD superfamily P-loop ATPase